MPPSVAGRASQRSYDIAPTQRNARGRTRAKRSGTRSMRPFRNATAVSVSLMGATDAPLKLDHSARRPDFIFTEEHERLRESLHAFVVKELQAQPEE
jgi:hypothetical protein